MSNVRREHSLETVCVFHALGIPIRWNWELNQAVPAQSVKLVLSPSLRVRQPPMHALCVMLGRMMALPPRSGSVQGAGGILC